MRSIYKICLVLTLFSYVANNIQSKAIDKDNESFISSWSNPDIRYTPVQPFGTLNVSTWKANAWKGERIHNQLVLCTKQKDTRVSLRVTNLRKGNGEEIDSSNISIGFQHFVQTDHLAENGSGCGLPANLSARDSSWVYDRIGFEKDQIIKVDTIYPVWVSIKVPRDISTGTYRGDLIVSSESGSERALKIVIQVNSRTLPMPDKWSYHLDLWQNPYASARYFNVPVWSDAHLKAMEPTMKQLAHAGQKVVTTTLIHKAWGEQTYDYYNTMVLRSKKIDGTWSFNYDIFDRWVSFMMSMGINEQINCYSIAPWKEDYQYFDEASNSHKYVRAKVGDAEYDAFWREFLKSFAVHLKERGWFDKTTIAMDERPLDIMKHVIRLIRSVDSEFKISLAGEYHAEIEKEIYDYCIAFYGNFPNDIIEKRKREGKRTTFYTCCTEAIPNTFTFSKPAESTWLGWYASANNYSGYLRWAYDCWNQYPTTDSRFSTFSAGDCFLVYPNSFSSIRMERLIEGIQDYEKIRALREEYKNNPAESSRIDKVLNIFMNRENLYEQGAAVMINNAREELRKIGF